MRASFWKGRRVLVTGHTGFKGTWLTILLERLGARVTGFSLAELESPSLFSLTHASAGCDDRRGDVRNSESVREIFSIAKPEVVFHLAAQSLVRRSYEVPSETFEVNALGTLNVLEALRTSPSALAAVLVTTDKVYENDESERPFVETMALGGYDPYSASKAAAEIVVSSYRRSFFGGSATGIATARAGNVIGGGDFASARLVPDMMRAFAKNEPVVLRNPKSTRPFEHVLEPLAGYLTLAERLAEGDLEVRRAFNFGPEPEEVATVEHVAELARVAWGDSATVEVGSDVGPHEAKSLGLDVSLARSLLGHRPRLSLDEAVRRTVRFYRELSIGVAAKTLATREIEEFFGSDLES